MKYGLIGEHLPHSYSKEIHNKLAPYDYQLLELDREALDGFMRAREFDAINVTIPYKQDVIPYLSEIDEHARLIGAVNTIVNRDGRLFGYNTDYYGMKALIERVGLRLQGKTCDKDLSYGALLLADRDEYQSALAEKLFR